MPTTTAYHELIVTTATRYALDAELLEAQVVVESSGRADALRYEPLYYERTIRHNPHARAANFGPLAACSFGLLQILLETAYERGFLGLPHHLFDAAVGLEWGVRQLVYLLQLFNQDYAKALAAYNAGPGNLAAGVAYAQKVFVEAGVHG